MFSSDLSVCDDIQKLIYLKLVLNYKRLNVCISQSFDGLTANKSDDSWDQYERKTITQ